jgi:light-regulated signal transduction histidine kinase (bacteriophytochrome)
LFQRLSTSVSHDLRSPLRGIDGFSQALLEDYGDKLDENGKQYLNHVRDGAQRMGVIIDDLLNLSRITRTDLLMQPTDLTKIARESIAHLQQQNPERKVEVLIKEGALVHGDPGLLRLVMDNLLSNSWKFSSKTLSARIEFGFNRTSETVIYFVKDNGVGFDMAFSNKLFGAFQRLHSAEDYKGTGVGLATSKRIIDRHNGRIWAESEIGKGTIFYFELGGQHGKV